MAPDELFTEVQSNLAEAARSLFASGTVEGTLQITVDLAVATIDGCDEAGIFVLRDGEVITTRAGERTRVENLHDAIRHTRGHRSSTRHPHRT